MGGGKRKVTAAPASYQVLMDWWVALLVFLLVVLLVTSMPVVVWLRLPSALTGVTLLGLVLTTLYVVDLGFFTSYALTKEGLVIRSQFRHFLFPYRLMKSVRQGGWTGLISLGGRKRFGLSADCLLVSMEGGSWRQISLSPRQKQQFLSQLLNNVDAERSARATYSEDAGEA